MRLILGRWLQALARRLLSTPDGLQFLGGDDLTRMALIMGIERESDAELRERLKQAWRGV